MLATLGTNTYNGVAKYPLIAIPLFILTGLVFEKAGVALRLVRFAQAWTCARCSPPACSRHSGRPGAAGVSRHYGWESPEQGERPPLGESFKQALPALFAPVLILGGLRSGLFTPTEAAVVGVTYGVLIGLFVTRELDWRSLWRLCGEAGVISGVVMLIIALAGIFAWAGTMLGTFRHLAEWLISLSDNGWVLLALVMLAVLLAGMLLDAISIYLILMPILIPVMQHFGWNPVWFGILLAMNIAIGQFTPPVAINLMVTAEVAKIRLEQTVGWAALFVVVMSSALLLVAIFPEIALWLPRVLGYAV